MADTYHLSRRGGGIWYYFRKVPKELVPIVGKQFIKRSLRTSDKTEAKKRRTLEEIKTDAYFAECLAQAGATPNQPFAPSMPSLATLEEYLRSAVEADNARTLKAFAGDPPKDADQLEDMRADAEHALQILNSPDDPRRSQTVLSFGKRVLKEAGAGEAALDLPDFVELIRQALVELHKRKIARYDDQHDRLYFNPLFDPTRAKAVSFKELAKTYLEVKIEEYSANGVSKKREDKVRSIVRTLGEIIGEDTPVAAIDHATVQTVRSTLAKLPSRRLTLYPELPLVLAIQRGEADGRAKLSSTTQQFYLDELRGLLKLAKLRKYLADNPAEEAKPLQKAALAPAERRLPWTNDQIARFFTSDFYRSCAPDAVQPYMGKDREWRFWIPLIMLFSGARPNEIAQLRAHDIRTSPGGTVYFDFTNEADAEDAMQVKTATSRRRIPIHSDLVRIGLLEYVKERRLADGADARLFPTLKPDKYGNLARYPLKRFGETFLPKEAGLTERQSLYSLRHNVRDAFRRVDATPGVLQAIGGWAPASKSVSDHYGDPKNPDLYRKWVDSIAYEGLDLSFLYRGAA